MRQVGQFTSRSEAERFAGVLVAKGWQVQLVGEEEPIRLWLEEEAHLQEARELYQLFLKDPKDGRFSVVAKLPSKPENPHPKPKIRTVSHGDLAFVTISLIAISVLATILHLDNRYQNFTKLLYFSNHLYPLDYAEIRVGQIWRLWTPMFLHGGWLHLLFNMLWMYQLGGQLEQLASGKKLVFFVALVGLICHIAQYHVSGPYFVGMSGVVYGLLGYLYIMSRYGMNSQFHLEQQTFVLMLVWLVVCLVGLIPNVANTQHIVGLFMGCTWGLWESGYYKTLWRRWNLKRKM